ncbi:MAG TPA: hypothetical protein VJ846_09020 [Sphingomicrobium sp.]|nr:hypothetical protein [Sphingomicrobium sp.]
MIAFSCMVADGRAQIFQVSPSATSITPFPSVSATRLAAHLTEHFCAPPRIQSLDALLEFSYGGNGVFVFAINFEAITKLFQLRIQVYREDVRNRDIINVPDSPFRRVLGGDVFL